MANPLGPIQQLLGNLLNFVVLAGSGFLLAYGLYKYLPRLMKSGEGKAVLIFDIERRVVKAEPAEEITTGILKTATGDIVIVPSGYEVFKMRSGRSLIEVYPVIRLGKKLAAIPASRFLELQVIGRHVESVRDVPDLLLALMESGAIQDTVKVAPGAEVAVAFKPSEVAKAAVELMESEADELLGAMLRVTTSKQEFEAMLRALLAYEQAKQTTMLIGSLKWLLLLIGAGLTAVLVFSVLGAH